MQLAGVLVRPRGTPPPTTQKAPRACRHVTASEIGRRTSTQKPPPPVLGRAAWIPGKWGM
ncbi:hypothetical protein OH77DRAFT_1428770 [Trametes cingulata]|nr:hypothetical protein OH77DRAFT_1428770 [Trametes cingulata]